MSEPNRHVCLWCARGFTPRGDGGKRQVFCRPVCHRAFDAAGRRWVAEAIAGGILTLDSLRNGAVATRALLSETISPAPVSVPRNPPPQRQRRARTRPPNYWTIS
jgi:hypothetical protein